MADHSSFISSDEFKSMRHLIKSKLSCHIQELFVEKAKQSLLSAPLSVTPKFAERAATDIIVRGQRIFENVDQCDTTPEQARLKKLEKDKLYKMSDRFRNLKDEAVLILDTCSTMFEQCDGVLLDQFENFGDIYPNVRNNPAEFPVARARPQNHEALKETVVSFFQKAALYAKTVVIVYNGIVKQHHLIISENCSYPLSAFMENVREWFVECFGYNMLPFVVDIAFQELSDTENTGSCVNVVNFSYQSGLSLVTQNYKCQNRCLALQNNLHCLSQILRHLQGINLKKKLCKFDFIRQF